MKRHTTSYTQQLIRQHHERIRATRQEKEQKIERQAEDAREQQHFNRRLDLEPYFASTAHLEQHSHKRRLLPAWNIQERYDAIRAFRATCASMRGVADRTANRMRISCHECTEDCTFRGDNQRFRHYFVCVNSGNVHLCTSTHCQHRVRQRFNDVCLLTGGVCQRDHLVEREYSIGLPHGDSARVANDYHPDAGTKRGKAHEDDGVDHGDEDEVEEEIMLALEECEEEPSPTAAAGAVAEADTEDKSTRGEKRRRVDRGNSSSSKDGKQKGKQRPHARRRVSERRSRQHAQEAVAARRSVFRKTTLQILSHTEYIPSAEQEKMLLDFVERMWCFVIQTPAFAQGGGAYSQRHHCLVMLYMATAPFDVQIQERDDSEAPFYWVCLFPRIELLCENMPTRNNCAPFTSSMLTSAENWFKSFVRSCFLEHVKPFAHEIKALAEVK